MITPIVLHDMINDKRYDVIIDLSHIIRHNKQLLSVIVYRHKDIECYNRVHNPDSDTLLLQKILSDILYPNI